MKKILKRIFLVLLVLIVAVTAVFSTYLISFVKSDENFDLKNGDVILKEKTEIIFEQCRNS